MTLPLTKKARLAAQALKKQPALIVEFEGIDERFGSARILKVVRIGDPDLFIGNDWKIGGFVALEDQSSNLSFDADFGKTSSKIDYQLDPDRGVGSSVTSLSLAFVDDRQGSMLKIISQYEMLARKCKIWLTPNSQNTGFPEDYVIIFRGTVDTIEAGAAGIVLNISHPDAKKRQPLFPSYDVNSTSDVSSGATSITLDSVQDVLVPIAGPDGMIDPTLQFFMKWDDEIIRYTGLSGNTLTGITRGALGTTANAHTADNSLNPLYKLEATAMDLAVKLMLSGLNDYFVTDIKYTEAKSGTFHDYGFGPQLISGYNGIFFQERQMDIEYGLTIGDYVTFNASSLQSAYSMVKISDLVSDEDGTWIYFDSSVTIVEEINPDPNASVSFRSKYDCLGYGFQMSPEEVDVAQHELLQDLFLGSFGYIFYLDDSIEDGKDFIEQQIYSPIACYSVPRKGQASVGYHIGPLPTTSVKVIDENNVRTPSKIIKKRSTGRNFYNTILYQFDKQIAGDKYLQGQIYINEESREDIPYGTKALTVVSDGLRSANTAQINASRRLNRYAFAAEYFNGIKISFQAGFNVEVGDLVIFDGSNLQVPDFQTGKRDAKATLYEVVSKTFDIRTGDISIDLTNTNYATSNRYALISPSSYVKSATSDTQFTIESSFDSPFKDREFEKWTRFLPDLFIKVRNADFSVEVQRKVDRFSGNTVILETGLGFTPSAGMIMEMADYTTSLARVELIYGWIAPDDTGFSNGDEPYRMI